MKRIGSGALCTLNLMLMTATCTCAVKGRANGGSPPGYTKLKLGVNEVKTSVRSAYAAKFLGYALWVARGGEVKRAVARAALTVFKRRVRQITRGSGGRSMGQGDRGARRLRAQAGRVDASPAASDSAQTRETRYDDLPRDPPMGCCVIAGATGCEWRPPLVAGLCSKPETRAYRGVLRSAGCAKVVLTSTSRTARCGPACRVVTQGRAP